MDPLIFYCHGFNSSFNSDKVKLLKSHFEHTYAWDIDIDPTVSIPFLRSSIVDVLIDYMHHPVEMIMVGTSLGAWYAHKLADIFRSKAILINPCFNPGISLKKYGVEYTILQKYDSISVNKEYNYFIAEHDEIIDFSPYKEELKTVNTRFFLNATHRFNGEEFNSVIDEIKNIVSK